MDLSRTWHYLKQVDYFKSRLITGKGRKKEEPIFPKFDSDHKSRGFLFCRESSPDLIHDKWLFAINNLLFNYKLPAYYLRIYQEIIRI